MYRDDDRDPIVLLIAALAEVSYDAAMSDIQHSVDDGVAYEVARRLVFSGCICTNTTAYKNWARLNGQKVCQTCVVAKNLSEFTKYKKQYRERIMSVCDECRRKAQA